MSYLLLLFSVHSRIWNPGEEVIPTNISDETPTQGDT
jgi:hypothetical protein